MSSNLRDILKIAAGVFLGLFAFAIVSNAIQSLTPVSPEARAAQDLLERQFAPAH